MEALRLTMRKWVTGVSIVTAEWDGIMHGMTVGSLVSISIDPPRIAITLANQTRTCQLVDQSGNFGVTLLNASQQELAEIFAGKISDGGDRMADLPLKRLAQNIPVLAGGLGMLACRVVHRYEMPASTLFVGEVLEAQVEQDFPALVYGNHRFHRLEL